MPDAAFIEVLSTFGVPTLISFYLLIRVDSTLRQLVGAVSKVEHYLEYLTARESSHVIH